MTTNRRKFTLITFFTMTANMLFPVYAAVLCLTLMRNVKGYLFLAFLIVALAERAWETFSTSKEHRREEFHGDWTLAAVTGTYLVLFFLLTAEFYVLQRPLNYWITGFGLLLWVVSLRLRFWGMAALGKQWAVHAVGARKIKKVRLVKIGPFRYIRHPIYLGIILEVLSFPIIANAYLSLLFGFIVCVPLVVLRAGMEEKASIRRFGAQYLKYKDEVGMFFPAHIFSRK